MRGNKSKVNSLVFMFVYLSINLLLTTKVFADVSDKTATETQGYGGFCLCQNCGEKQIHERGVPCRSLNCPKCKSTMIRASQGKNDVKEIDIAVIKQGAGGFCICPHCGEKQVHEMGIPCRTVDCPKCKSTMIRELQEKNDIAAIRQEASDFCICPHCSEKQIHERGVPCRMVNCLKCKSAMIKD